MLITGNAADRFSVLMLFVACFVPVSAWAGGSAVYSGNTATAYFGSMSSGADMQGAASSIYSGQTNSSFGSAVSIQQNGFNPVISTSSPMTSLTGTKPFSAQTMCPSTPKIVSVSFGMLSSGDLAVTVSQDTDFSGSYNYTYNVPEIVSAVCDNGFLSCQPGSMTGCSYYQWALNGQPAPGSGVIGTLAAPSSASTGSTIAQITSIPTSLQNLSSCYCINNYAGATNLAMYQPDQILTSLGTGVMSVIQAAYPKQAISKSDYSLNTAYPTINYYGQQESQCASTGPAGAADPTSYFNPQSDSALLAAANTATSTDTYTVLLNSPAITNRNASTIQCTNTHIFTINDQTEAPQYQWLPWLAVWDECSGYFADWNDTTCSATVMLDTNNDGIYDLTSAVATGNPVVTFGTSAGSNTDFITIMNAHVQNVLIATQGTYSVPSTNVQVDMSSSSTSTTPYDFSVCAGNIDIPRWSNNAYFGTCWGLLATDKAYAFYAAKFLKKTPPLCDTASDYQYCAGTCQCVIESVVNTIDAQCDSYQHNSNCQLETEIVDGVQTYANFNPTDLTPFQTSKNITGCLMTATSSPSWWVDKRTYACTDASAYDLSDMKTRVKVVNNSVTPSGSSITYDDTKKDMAAGIWSSTTGNTIIINTSGTPGNCTQACKTSKPVNQNQVAQSGTTSQYSGSASTFLYYYHPCTNNVCPVGKGETQVTGCQCPQNFGTATAAVAAVVQASKDMICSSGTTTTTP